jgi:hypothetical protein
MTTHISGNGHTEIMTRFVSVISQMTSVSLSGWRMYSSFWRKCSSFWPTLSCHSWRTYLDSSCWQPRFVKMMNTFALIRQYDKLTVVIWEMRLTNLYFPFWRIKVFQCRPRCKEIFKQEHSITLSWLPIPLSSSMSSMAHHKSLVIWGQGTWFCQPFYK